MATLPFLSLAESTNLSPLTNTPTTAYDSYAPTYDELDDSKWVTELLGLRRGRQELLGEVRCW